MQQTCQQVSAVLSEGPDPDADPLGHAQAQILPLEQVHASDQALSKAISALASAYSRYIGANGTGKAAKSALTAAINRINSLFPGASCRTRGGWPAWTRPRWRIPRLGTTHPRETGSACRPG